MSSFCNPNNFILKNQIANLILFLFLYCFPISSSAQISIEGKTQFYIGPSVEVVGSYSNSKNPESDTVLHIQNGTIIANVEAIYMASGKQNPHYYTDSLEHNVCLKHNPNFEKIVAKSKIIKKNKTEQPKSLTLFYDASDKKNTNINNYQCYNSATITQSNPLSNPKEKSTQMLCWSFFCVLMSKPKSLKQTFHKVFSFFRFKPFFQKYLSRPPTIK